MKRMVWAVVACGVCLSVVRGAEPPPGDDAEALRGVWRGVSLEVKGDPLPPLSARSLRLRFDRDTFTVEQGGKVTVLGRYTLDPSAKPRAIDLTITETVQAVNNGASVLGVYAVEKDRLTLCTTKANDAERPKKLASKAGTTHSLFVFRKEKP